MNLYLLIHKHLDILYICTLPQKVKESKDKIIPRKHFIISQPCPQ